MSSHIVTDFELSVKEGKLDDFKAVVNTMIEMTDVNEPNTQSTNGISTRMAASVTYLKLSRTLTHSWSTWEMSVTCLTHYLDSQP